MSETYNKMVKINGIDFFIPRNLIHIMICIFNFDWLILLSH